MIELQLEKKLDQSLLKSTIIPYQKEIHHSLIPRLYAEGFNDDLWKYNWDSYEFFDPNGVFLATESGQFSGFIISYQRNYVGHISVLTVLPQFRGFGIATDLIICASNFLFEKGLHKITIRVEPENDPALQLYKKFGFVPKQSEK